MPRKKTTEGESSTGFTDGELRFIKAIFDNMNQKPDADWEAVARTLGLKDSKCTKERFRQMSIRHGWRDPATAASPRKAVSESKVAKKPRTPRKKAVKKDENEDVEDEDEIKGKDGFKAEGGEVILGKS